MAFNGVVCTCRCRAGKASAVSTDGELKPGMLVEWQKDGKARLSLVQAPDGKKNFWVVDAVGGWATEAQDVGDARGGAGEGSCSFKCSVHHI